MTSSAAQPGPSASEGAATPSPPADTGGKASGAMTITGTVTAGVEANCLLIDGYLLVGGPREQLRSGTRVTVTGRVQKGMMTTCQQGTPFVVETVHPA